MVCVFAGDTKLCAFLVVAEGSLCFLMNSDDFWLPNCQRWICMSMIQCEKNDVKIMSNQHSNKCQLSTSWTKSLSRMCAQWKWNHASHWIISSIESLVYHCGSRQEWECLNVCFAWLWKKWEDFHLETQHEVTSYLSIMLFPEAMWSAVAITNRPQSHSSHCWTGIDDMRRPLFPCSIFDPCTWYGKGKRLSYANIILIKVDWNYWPLYLHFYHFTIQLQTHSWTT